MKKTVTVLSALACACFVLPASAQTPAPVTQMVSEGGNDSSRGCDVSRGGTAVSFYSDASNLVPRDTNGVGDVFLATAGGVERVSVTSREKQSVVRSSGTSISDDGSRVAFVADGYRLQRRSGHDGIFVRGVADGVTERVNVAADGGRPDARSSGGVISGNGRHVAFSSEATNLVKPPADGTWSDTYVRALARDRTERVSFALGGGEPEGGTNPDGLSHDGRYIVFTSEAPDIVRGDDNEAADVFRHDRKTGRTIRVSVASDGSEAGHDLDSRRASVSADGRYVAFVSRASLDAARPTEHLAVYVHDVFTGTTELVSTGPEGPADAYSDEPSISADGRYVAFLSAGSNLVPDDTNDFYEGAYGVDGFVHDRTTGETRRVTVGDEGEESNGDAGDLAISPDGQYVCWSTKANNLVEPDDHDGHDVFLRGPLGAGEE